MNRFHYFAIGMALVAGLTASAQQAITAPDDAGAHAARGHLPTVDQQLKVLTEKLDLTADQQTRIKPIFQKLHDATEEVMRNSSLSRQERMAKVTPQWYEADKQIRATLSEDQKARLDQYEQGPHPEMHGDLGGTESATPENPRGEQAEVIGGGAAGTPMCSGASALACHHADGQILSSSALLSAFSDAMIETAIPSSWRKKNAKHFLGSRSAGSRSFYSPVTLLS